MSVAKSNGARKPGLHGRRPAHHFPELSLERFYAGQARPPLPDAADVSFGITEWGMLANDRLQNCGSAAIAHARMTKACVSPGVAGAEPTYEPGFVPPSVEEVEHLYYEYGIAHGEKPPHPNEGVVNALWLAWLYERGTIEGYAEIDVAHPGTSDRVRRAMIDFRGVFVGLNLTDNADQLFLAGKPWSTADGQKANPRNGHDVLMVSFAESSDTFVTWGALQKSTFDWDSECVEEAWVILTKEDAKRAGYDFEAAKAAMDEVSATRPKTHAEVGS